MIADDVALVEHDGASSHAFPATHESFSIWSANADGERSGGDWCAIVPVSEHAVALSIGDVAGHGLAAAAELGIMHAAILGALTETRVPSDVLVAANAVAYNQASPIIVTAIAIRCAARPS